MPSGWEAKNQENTFLVKHYLPVDKQEMLQRLYSREKPDAQ
jgi:hypothetical protein